MSFQILSVHKWSPKAGFISFLYIFLDISFKLESYTITCMIYKTMLLLELCGPCLPPTHKKYCLCPWIKKWLKTNFPKLETENGEKSDQIGIHTYSCYTIINFKVSGHFKITGKNIFILFFFRFYFCCFSHKMTERFCAWLLFLIQNVIWWFNYFKLRL